MNLRPLALAAVAALASCFPSDPPSDLQIACEHTSDCPEHYACSTEVGLCVRTDIVNDPPGLAGLPVIEPATARAGVTLTVSLVVTEALLSDPVVRVGQRTLAVDETGTVRGKLVYRFAYKVQGTEAATEPVTVDLTDLKGATSSGLDGGTAAFDFEVPPAPQVDVAGTVVYHRVPWGAQATGGEERYWIEAAAGATEKGVQVVAWDGASAAEGAGELGRTTAADDGSFVLQLMRVDHPVIWLESVDAAGNQSPAVDVKDVTWTATLAGKVPGKEFENPHGYELRPWFERRRWQDDAQELSKAGPLDAWDGIGLEASGDTASGAWMRKSVSETYSRRSSHAVAYDAARGKMVLFGGQGWADTWLWDGAAWSKKVPLDLTRDGNPASRSRHAMAYDAERDRVVLFGGADHSGDALADTWEWDGVEWVSRKAAGPAARFGHAMVYDPARRRVVLFGGQTEDAQGSVVYLNDLWEWDGASWTRGASANPPGGRSGHALAMDTKRGRMVLFGGEGRDASGSVVLTRDTWEYDGAAWTRAAPADPPAARSRAAAAFLPELGTVLFGGEDDAGGYLAETWVWNGTLWRKLAPATAPDKRARATLVYDSARNRGVLCGGLDDTDDFGDTWELDGEEWVARTGPATEERSPAARSWQAMAHDEARGVTVLFGGSYDSSSGNTVYLGDTWEWDGSRWTEKTPAEGEPRPLGRKSPAMAYDRARGRVVLFGGVNGEDLLNDTWEWDGTYWKERVPLDPTVTDPSVGLTGRYGHAMAWDDAEGEVVLFGGTGALKGWVSFDDTWLWDGNAWRKALLTGQPPSGRCYHAMAYDQLRARVVLYGGQPYDDVSDWVCPPCGFPYAADDTYEWDGGRWSKKQPQGETVPTTLVAHAMVYSQRGPALMFGGGSWLFGGSPLDETWAWDGLGWSPAVHGAHDDGSPEPRSGHSMAYDPARSRAVLFGGFGKAGSALGDTWEWDDGSSARPGQVARFAFAAAEAEADTVIRSASVTWVAGGQGEKDGNAVSGVSTWVWDRGSFMPAASGAGTVDSPAVVTWRTDDETVASRLLNGPRQEITIAVTPQGLNGKKSARVTVDDVELAVEYRRPAQSAR